jgi:hypothetical protein
MYLVLNITASPPGTEGRFDLRNGLLRNTHERPRVDGLPPSAVESRLDTACCRSSADVTPFMHTEDFRCEAPLATRFCTKKQD